MRYPCIDQASHAQSTTHIHGIDTQANPPLNTHSLASSNLDTVDSSAPQSYTWRDVRCSYEQRSPARGDKPVEVEVRLRLYVCMFGWCGCERDGWGLRRPCLLRYTPLSDAHPRTRCHNQVLHGVDGHLKTGQMLAVIGPSGSGKTCLLDILAERKTIGKISGLRLLDGQVRGRAVWCCLPARCT